MKIKKILVPTDFSKFSDKALEAAFVIAKKFDAKIVLFHSILLFQEEGNDLAQFDEYLNYLKSMEEESKGIMQGHQKSAAAEGIKLETRIARGFSAADTILEQLEDEKFDLVVMGTHGRRGLKKWLYGSVAEKVVRLSPVPVLTTHYSDKPFEIKKVLIPVDFSDYSKNAIRYAKKLAEMFEAKRVYLHSIFYDFHPAYFAGGIESITALDPELKSRTMKQLKKFCNDPDGEYVVVEGSAAHSIVDYAEHNDISLIVMATRGLTGLDHILIGSTTERVVSLAKTPVLTIERKKNK